MRVLGLNTKINRLLLLAALALLLASCGVISDRLAARGGQDLQGARAVKAALMASASVNASPIRVSKIADQIELSGFVESEDERSAAEDIVGELYPEASITNAIKVK